MTNVSAREKKAIFTLVFIYPHRMSCVKTFQWTYVMLPFVFKIDLGIGVKILVEGIAIIE